MFVKKFEMFVIGYRKANNFVVLLICRSLLFQDLYIYYIKKLKELRLLWLSILLIGLLKWNKWVDYLNWNGVFLAQIKNLMIRYVCLSCINWKNWSFCLLLLHSSSVSSTMNLRVIFYWLAICIFIIITPTSSRRL